MSPAYPCWPQWQRILTSYNEGAAWRSYVSGFGFVSLRVYTSVLHGGGPPPPRCYLYLQYDLDGPSTLMGHYIGRDPQEIREHIDRYLMESLL